jgi:spore maturation protein CgeB
MKIVIYGLTITSAWGNGHATTYRSLVKALARRGHRVTFIEKDVEWYRNNRDLPNPVCCTVRLYDDWETEKQTLLREAADADAIVVGSYFPDAIAASRALLNAAFGPVLFYDIDTPVTMSQLRAHGRCEYLEASLIPKYSAYLSFTGGPTLHELETRFGSPYAVPFYCSVNPDLYEATAVRDEFRCTLSYLGTYATDRQEKLMQLLNGSADRLPADGFLVAGAMYPGHLRWAGNVRRLTHVAPPEHPAFYSSSRFTLNLTRADMVAAGYSPSVRLFEASACGAAILSDDWLGLNEFFTPGEEILLPANAQETTVILRELSDAERRRIGARARERVLAEHTSEHRAREFETIVSTCGAGRTTARLPVEAPRRNADRAPAALA